MKLEKLYFKSSTEAEMITVSDDLGNILWSRKFLLCQRYDLPPATIFQDNHSTISLSAHRNTRHLCALITLLLTSIL